MRDVAVPECDFTDIWALKDVLRPTCEIILKITLPHSGFLKKNLCTRKNCKITSLFSANLLSYIDLLDKSRSIPRRFKGSSTLSMKNSFVNFSQVDVVGPKECAQECAAVAWKDAVLAQIVASTVRSFRVHA